MIRVNDEHVDLLPGTRHSIPFIVNSGEGLCGFDSIGNMLQEPDIFFRKKDRCLWPRLRKELCGSLGDPMWHDW